MYSKPAGLALKEAIYDEQAGGAYGDISGVAANDTAGVTEETEVGIKCKTTLTQEEQV